MVCAAAFGATWSCASNQGATQAPDRWHLNGAHISQKLKSQRRSFQACHAAILKYDPQAGARLDVMFEIDLKGGATVRSVTFSQVHMMAKSRQQHLGRCVSSVIEGLTFHLPAKESALVKKTFVFCVEGTDDVKCDRQGEGASSK